MLNYETLLSSYDDKLTLLQWLKKVEAALKDASAVSFNVNKKGDATLTFSIVFEDGSEIESGEIVLQQGESVESAAIVNGHLILTLTNGDELDAGQLLNGDLNVSGNLSVTGKITGAEIVENMTGYNFYEGSALPEGVDIVFAGAVKNGNKITFAVAMAVLLTEALNTSVLIGGFNMPQEVSDKIIPSFSNYVDIKDIQFASSGTSTIGVKARFIKASSTTIQLNLRMENFVAGTQYYGRYECTFLLCDNMAA